MEEEQKRSRERPKDAHEALVRSEKRTRLEGNEWGVSEAYEAVKPFLDTSKNTQGFLGALALLAFFAFVIWVIFGGG